LEALGGAQTAADNADINFAASEIVGAGFAFTSPSNQIIIDTPGLYLIEWSLNLAAGNPASLVGLYGSGKAVSIAANSATGGNFSSGVLINVTATPYTLSLRNFSGASISLESGTGSANSAASIRILKFADKPTA
jgi:hypothetical protein